MKKYTLTILLIVLCRLLVAQPQNFGYSVKPDLSSCTPNSTEPIQGSFTVGEMGNATYSVPIAVPQGVNNLQPSLSLCYNSMSGNGICGLGFNLAGLSTIVRVSGNLFYDNCTADKVVNSNYWAMALDGQRLITLNNSTFYIENDPLSKGYFIDGTESIIIDKEGCKYKYDKIFYKTDVYYLRYISDSYGNKITYSYYLQDNYAYISNIQYGDGAGKTEIKFEYETRDDVVYFFNNASGKIKLRLHQIEVVKNNNLFKKYLLHYMMNNGVSVMNMIKEQFDDLIVKNPIYLAWGDYNINSIKDKKNVSIQNMSTCGFENLMPVSGDFDGDGIDDLILISSNEKIPSGNGKYQDYSYAYYYKCSKGIEPTFSFYKKINMGPNIYLSDIKNYQASQFLVDFDGDGINELFIPSLEIYDFDGVDIRKFNITIYRHSQVETPLTIPINLTLKSAPVFCIGDFYGMGTSSIILVEKNTKTKDPLRFQILNYDNDYKKIKLLGFDVYVPGTPEQMLPGDFDGDGLIDILVVCKDASLVLWNRGSLNGAVFSDACKTKVANIKSSASIIRVGDFDGDGCSEIFFNDVGSTAFNILKNNGNRSFEYSCTKELTNVYDISDTEKDNQKYGVEVADINYDGKDDILISKAMYKHHKNKSWYDFSINYDYWLTSDGTNLRVFYNKSWTEDKDESAYFYYTVGDFNGDGFKEILRLGADNQWYIHKSFNSLSKVNSFNKVSSITTLAQDSIKISYSSLLDKSVFQKGDDAEYPVLNLITPKISVVSSVTQTNGVAPNITTNYKYSSLKAHLKGRGLLGFDAIEISQPLIHQTTINTILKRDPIYFIPIKTKSTDNFGNSSIVNYKVSKLDSKNYFAYPSLIETTDIYGKTTFAYNDYHSKYGYLISNKVVYSDSSYVQTKYDNYKLINTVYHPQLVTKIQKHKDDQKSFVTKSYYEYNSKGSISKSVSNYQTDFALTNIFEHDKFGNVVRQLTMGKEKDTIVDYYKYDSFGRLLLEHVSAPSQMRISYTYDDYDNLITVTDNTDSSNPLTTRYKYDIWRRNIETVEPDSTVSSTFFGWTDYMTRYVVTMGTATPWIKTYYDNAGHVIKEETASFVTPFKGMVSVTDYSYNKFNKVVKTTKTIGNYIKVSTDKYDDYGRISKHIDSVHTISYTYDKNKVEVLDNGRNTITTYDDWGNIKSVTEPNGNTIKYSYSSNGKPSKISSDDAQVVITYYPNGLRKSITDTDAGTENYEYDSFGNVIKYVNSKNKATINYYSRGLLVKSTCDSITTDYEYDIKSRLINQKNNTSSISYKYDKYGRLSKQLYHIDGKSFVYLYKYTDAGLLSSKIFPDNSVERYYYDCFGNHYKTMLDTCDIWAFTSDSAYNQGVLTLEKIGAKIFKISTYNIKGVLKYVDFFSSKIGSPLFDEQSYSYDKYLNIVARQINNGDAEHFAYDDADRLVEYNDNTVSYSKSGNIINKTNIGDYEYSAHQPHALTFVSDPDNLIKPFDMDIEYTAFKKPSRIVDTKTDGQKRTYSITYSPDQNRIKSEFKDGDYSLTTYYLPDFELEIQNGITTTRHYVYSSSGSLAAINFRQGDNNDIYLAVTDHQGSLISLYDCSMRLKFSARYSPFGVRTITLNELPYNLPRGYTMHEHFVEFGLINMNSRLYSPYLSRFLAPDPYIQDPANSQNFNRYSYCLNNPLKYTDPSGEKWKPWILGAFLLDPVSFCVTVCATATAATGLFTTITASGLMPFQGTLFALSIPSKNYDKKICNAFQIDKGMFRAKNFWHWNSRYSWESLQTGLGNMYSHIRNIIGKVDRVDYYDGATFCVDEYSDKNDGITIGNFININIKDYVKTDFESYLKSSHDGLFMHEYGHTIQGRHYGFAYLFNIGIPSLLDAKNPKYGSHRERWFEREASAYSRDYFGNYWSIYSTYPTYGF